MKKSSVQLADEIEQIMYTHGNMLFRLSLAMLGNASDAEDVVQETLIKYIEKKPEFESEEHKKSWLITVVSNRCKDLLRFHKKHEVVELEEWNSVANENIDSGILEALMTLPEKFRLVLILYYVEEYRIEDIAKIIGKTKSAVKMRLQKGRRLLEETYRKEYM